MTHACLRAAALAGAAVLAASAAVAGPAASPPLDPEAHPLLKILPWLPKSVRAPGAPAPPVKARAPRAPAPAMASAPPAPAQAAVPAAPVLAAAEPQRPAARPARASSLDPQAHPLLRILPWLPKSQREPHPADAPSQAGG